jgi:CubicO group peptidase (beta-lactamase class C family)
MTMKKWSDLIFFMLPWMFLHACEEGDEFSGKHVYSGINHIELSLLQEVDAIISEYTSQYRYISLGIIVEGQPALVRCYGENRLGKNDTYASVSKPLTSMITLQLLEEGLIRSLNDPIGAYCSKYREVLPDAYPDVPITFTHLLSHRSGIPHHEKIWNDGKLDLEFEPGSRMLYSTRGYGVLGDVISTIGGRSFNRMVKDYIGAPAGAPSISCPLPFFEAPGGLIHSTITDMALFASALLNGVFVDDSLLYDCAWIPLGSDNSGDMGLGWYITNQGTEELAVYHAGSNGNPRAFIVLKPHKKMGVVMLGKSNAAEGQAYFPDVARKIILLLNPLEGVE